MFTHSSLLSSQITIGFAPETIQSLMRLVMAVLFAGNMTFTASRDGESCTLDQTDAAYKTAALLGVSFENLAASLTSRAILAGNEIVHKPLHIQESIKACEALIKAVYGAAFDFIVEKVNESIVEDTTSHGGSAASIGVLDIFGFETFQTNNFEQICINYTNEALQQQFNKYVFKLEQQEYEKEGILWKFISFPDNQDVLDLIDMKHTGLLALLDEQCILPKSTDEKFTRYSTPGATSIPDSMLHRHSGWTTNSALSTTLDTWSTLRMAGWRRIRISSLRHRPNFFRRLTLISFLIFRVCEDRRPRWTWHDRDQVRWCPVLDPATHPSGPD